MVQDEVQVNLEEVYRYNFFYLEVDNYKKTLLIKVPQGIDLMVNTKLLKQIDGRKIEIQIFFLY